MEPTQWLTLLLLGLTILTVITNIIDNTLSPLVGVALIGQYPLFGHLTWTPRRLRLGMARAFWCTCGSMRARSEREDY